MMEKETSGAAQDQSHDGDSENEKQRFYEKRGWKNFVRLVESPFVLLFIGFGATYYTIVVPLTDDAYLRKIDAYDKLYVLTRQAELACMENRRVNRQVLYVQIKHKGDIEKARAERYLEPGVYSDSTRVLDDFVNRRDSYHALLAQLQVATHPVALYYDARVNLAVDQYLDAVFSDDGKANFYSPFEKQEVRRVQNEKYLDCERMTQSRVDMLTAMFKELESEKNDKWWFDYYPATQTKSTFSKGRQLAN